MIVARSARTKEYRGYLEPFAFIPENQTWRNRRSHWWAHEYTVDERLFDIRFDRDATRVDTETYIPVRVTVIERYVGCCEIKGIPEMVRWYVDDDPRLAGMWSRILCPIDRHVARTAPD